MAKHPNEGRREALCQWLTANGINPNDVPIDADLTITTETDGTRLIRYEAFVTDSDGRKLIDERGQGAAIEKRTARLDVEPPDWWQPHQKPTREQLAAELKKAQAAVQGIRENLVVELHRRQIRYDTGPTMTEEVKAHISGELIGLRVALGIALGYPAAGCAGIEAAMTHYDRWLTQRAAHSNPIR
ncbi:hypothetical protein ACFV27_36870 [Streptomyces antimycoticus]|uniref:hypothetical protein n=1 Tax=Streptomyces antimycoticus TaxID=68175 RepID=UPI003690CF76